MAEQKAGRDPKTGRLLPGHHLFGLDKGIVNGKKRTPKRLVKDALALVEDAMPQILAAMQARALNPRDRDSQRAAEYLCDRIYGKPSQPLAGLAGRPIEIVVTYENVPREGA